MSIAIEDPVHHPKSLQQHSRIQPVEWLEENGWCWVNHKRRGTWFSHIHRQWYELDGFVMREEQRHRHAKRIKTMSEAAVSDHKPKWMLVDIRKRKWRREYEARRIPAIKWEVLKNEQVASRFQAEAKQRLRSDREEVRTYSTRWTGLAGHLVEAARVTWGLRSKSVENEWLIGKEEEDKATRNNRSAGIVMRWVPWSAFPATQAWERGCSNAVEVRVVDSLFADDTTEIGDKKELETGVQVVKEVMDRFEERNNEAKEETLDFGSVKAGGVRVLGCWREDTSNRLSRAGKAWFAVENHLMGSRLSKRKQARVVEACVETALLFDCQVWVWQIKELRHLQSFMDRCYRYVWGNKRQPPLIQMQVELKNMFDLKKELGVKSVWWKVEKRALERIGHVMRMED